MANDYRNSLNPKPAVKARMGRPSLFDDDLANRFLDLIAEAKPVSAAASAVGVSPRSIYKWLVQYADFSQSYARAKDAAADALVEEILAIADDAGKDWIDGKIGMVFDADAVARSRLRIDARKWLAGKLRAKKYCRQSCVNHGGRADQSWP
jgi:hypothetical protein